MAIIKLVEPYAVNYARTCVRDALMYHGEESVLLSLYRETDNVQRCPRCHNDAYNDSEADCPVCYGTTWYSDADRKGGVRDARRAWCIFTDHSVSEQYGQYGTLTPDQRTVQTEAFPMLVEHDFIVRVKRWSPTHEVLEVGGFYQVEAVTRNSLRTGNQYGQTWQDVIGQSTTCSWIPPSTMGLPQLYPVLGETFPAATIQGTPIPTAVVEPDTKVVFYPINVATGNVDGATATWEAAFAFQQTAPAAVWTITHTLGHLPEVNIIVGGESVDAQVDYPNINTVVITFAAPQTGTAELN
jgi:hypothetical protein